MLKRRSMDTVNRADRHTDNPANCLPCKVIKIPAAQDCLLLKIPHCINRFIDLGTQIHQCIHLAVDVPLNFVNLVKTPCKRSLGGMIGIKMFLKITP